MGEGKMFKEYLKDAIDSLHEFNWMKCNLYMDSLSSSLFMIYFGCNKPEKFSFLTLKIKEKDYNKEVLRPQYL